MSAQFTKKITGKILLCFAILQLGCIKTSAAPYQYTIPETTNDGWECASLKTVGIDSNLIQQLCERIGDNTYKNIHSVLLVKSGKLVFENYFSGQNSAGQNQ